MVPSIGRGGTIRGASTGDICSSENNGRFVTSARLAGVARALLHVSLVSRSVVAASNAEAFQVCSFPDAVIVAVNGKT